MSEATEDPSNIGFVCPECGIEDYSDKEPSWFVGKYVKKIFTALNDEKERMWVRVHDVTKDGKLVGELNNDPVYPFDIKCGDSVTLDINEVIEVLED